MNDFTVNDEEDSEFSTDDEEEENEEEDEEEEEEWIEVKMYTWKLQQSIASIYIYIFLYYK